MRAREASPSFSPDGEWIAYRGETAGSGDILLRDIRGNRSLNLTGHLNADESDPAFSPDGRQIAFRSSFRNGGLYLIDREGKDVRRLTSFGASPAWTPDGRAIVFQHNEKTILDIDLLQMVAEFLSPLDLSEDALAVEAIRSVGPGGHFFGTQHTQDRYRNAFYAPVLSDWRNFESWSTAGRPTAVEKANRVWKERLAGYEKPHMDPAIREEIDAFVEKRRLEGGAPTDF